MSTRVVQRTPNLGLRLRMHKVKVAAGDEPDPRATPGGGEPCVPALEWWHEELGAWSPDPVTIGISPNDFCGDRSITAFSSVAIARLSCCPAAEVIWTARWDGMGFGVPGWRDGGPYVEPAGELLVVRMPPWTFWDEPNLRDGSLEVSAQCGEQDAGSLYLSLAFSVG